MGNEIKAHGTENQVPSSNETIKVKDDPLMIDEFDIVELEDRLELDNRCNGKCSIN